MIKKYFEEEWSLLHTFIKIYLLREEAEKRKKSVNQDWERDVFSRIADTLNSLCNLFKYDVEQTRDCTLKIMTAQFSEFSEYIIHKLFLEYSGKCRIDDQTQEEFRDLMEQITGISKNDVIPNGVNSNVKKINNEVDFCSKNGIKRPVLVDAFISELKKSGAELNFSEWNLHRILDY